MGYSSPSVGYDGYVASNDVLVEDTTEYASFGGGGYTTKITGKILTDLSSVSTVRFKISLKHDQLTHTITIILRIGGIVIWTQTHVATDANYHVYTLDKLVTWRRGASISVKAQATANTGFNKDFQICGKVSPFELD